MMRPFRNGKVGLRQQAARCLVTDADPSKNCTKHSCRCDYMEMSNTLDDRSNSPKEPNLLWSSEVKREIEAWQRTGAFPFPELHLQSHQHLRRLSPMDMRLVHHVASIYRDMRNKHFIQCTLWVQELPMYVEGFLSCHSRHVSKFFITVFSTSPLGMILS